jgi:uncharacterized SAM-binding protein YcdF (DUF218 family)
MMKCCFDKRVWAGLGVLAVVLLVADPHAGWAALPVLAGLACPLSMLFMMRGMRGGAEGSAAGDRAAEIARLRREIGQLRADASGPVPGPAAAIPPQGTRSGAV